jgi:pyruvate dehydrogenase E2 component (dihydrolipoamide acetyltransferase)
MQITTPDIGVDKATVAEILVKVGDSIAENDSLVLLESDKASVEVPSTSAGVVKSILIKEGDSVTEGTVLLELETAGAAPAAKAEEVAKPAPVAETAAPVAAPQTAAQPAVTSSQVVEVQVPDIGVEKALVAEILVKVGENIAENDSLVLLESDKASVEVPSTVSGTIESIEVKQGDSVKEGVVLIKVKTTSAAAPAPVAPSVETPAPAAPVAQAAAPVQQAQPAGDVEIQVPDLGVDKAVVAEILVQVGDKVEVDQSLVVVESDKATVEVPSTVAGVVKAIHLQSGQNVSQGILLATIAVEGQAAAPVAAASAPAATKAETAPVAAPAAKVEAPVAATQGVIS